MKTFRYMLNGFDSFDPKPLPTKAAPYLNAACRLVTGLLLTPERIVRTPLRFTAPILFEWSGESIRDADSAFLAETAIKASERPDIGCTVT